MGISTSEHARLAPPPDFRYVGLHPAGVVRHRLWAGVGLGASASAAFLQGSGALALAAAGAAGVALAVNGLRTWVPRRGCGTPMALVPWGVLVDPDHRPRVLHWAAVKSVDVETVHGSDEATPTTRWSVVTLDTGRERLVGRAAGEVALDRLTVHVAAYAAEAAHAVALDLDGEHCGEGPVEPDVEPLLRAARSWVESAPASSRLDLPPASYRCTSSNAASARALTLLSHVLRDRTVREADPRAFAAVLAAELGARQLVPDLLALTQSPHPVIAGVAKIAARKLGASSARVGTLDEIAPFLAAPDVAELEAWANQAL